MTKEVSTKVMATRKTAKREALEKLDLFDDEVKNPRYSCAHPEQPELLQVYIVKFDLK